MDQKTNSKNQMFWTVLTVLLKNKLIWETAPVLITMVDEFQAMLENIIETARVAGVTLTGVTDDKNDKLTVLRKMLFNVTAPLSSFAKRTKKFDLLAEVNLPEYKINKLRQNDAVRFAERVVGYLRVNKESLVEYGITAEKITGLEKAVSQVSEVLPAPSVSISERKVANEKLHLLVSQTEKFLGEEMDGMIVSFRETNDSFFNAYTNSRDVVEHGVRHEKKEAETVNTSETATTTAHS